ncbi:Hypothetical protein NTJ_08062 [Nesidiocoris tenuis]|uniref:Arrestin-like N-terminal domain-containing protein n=1 Tax=Nesidiocoris tenuis TaxID=355587 RepID=A0ABN7AT76_9HEMI|nr:Hypothetical protein NTJ_08062 [Nesidiocoris tenuis]
MVYLPLELYGQPGRLTFDSIFVSGGQLGLDWSVGRRVRSLTFSIDCSAGDEDGKGKVRFEGDSPHWPTPGFSAKSNKTDSSDSDAFNEKEVEEEEDSTREHPTRLPGASSALSFHITWPLLLGTATYPLVPVPHPPSGFLLT